MMKQSLLKNECRTKGGNKMKEKNDKLIFDYDCTTEIKLKKECCLPSVIRQTEVALHFIRSVRNNEITIEDVEKFLTSNIDTLKRIYEDY